VRWQEPQDHRTNADIRDQSSDAKTSKCWIKSERGSPSYLATCVWWQDRLLKTQKGWLKAVGNQEDPTNWWYIGMARTRNQWCSLWWDKWKHSWRWERITGLKKTRVAYTFGWRHSSNNYGVAAVLINTPPTDLHHRSITVRPTHFYGGLSTVLQEPSISLSLYHWLIDTSAALVAFSGNFHNLNDTVTRYSWGNWAHSRIDLTAT